MGSSKPVKTILRIFVLLVGLAILFFDFQIDRITHTSQAGFGKMQYLILVFGLLVVASAFYQKRWNDLLAGMIKWITYGFMKCIRMLQSVQERWFLFEILALLALGYAYLVVPLTRQYPVGYAGLYQLEIDRIISNHFSLPNSIPFYGPGGIPAAYPFLSLYIGAFFQHILGVPALHYLKYAPALWTLCAFAAAYFFFKEVSKERAKAVTAVLLMALTYEIFEKHATAAGIVRGPALFFSMLSLIGFWKITHGKKLSFWVIFGTGLATALTAMSHLSYLSFLVITCLALMLFVREVDLKTRLVRLAETGFFCVLFASPWWGTVLMRYGFATFLNAFNSHGTLELAKALVSGNVKNVLLSFFAGWGEVPLIGLTLLGLVYALVKRNRVTFWWFLFVFLLLGDNARFLILIGALLAADLILDVLAVKPAQNHKQEEGQKVLAALGLLLLTGFLWARFFYAIQQYPQALDADLVQAANWMKDNSAPEDRYLYFAGDHDTAEWLPWLSQRTPAVGHWGAEWLGDYALRFSQWEDLSNCADQASLDCLTFFSASSEVSYDYILAENPVVGVADPFQDAEFKMVYKNDAYCIYQVR